MLELGLTAIALFIRGHPAHRIPQKAQFFWPLEVSEIGI